MSNIAGHSCTIVNVLRSTSFEESAILEPEEHWVCGAPLQNLPVDRSLLPTFQAATKLLMARPWSKFKSFELLKVTIHAAMNEEEALSTRWLMFSSDECMDASVLTKSPYGFMHVMNSLEERNYMFGRQSLLIASGFAVNGSPPDRLYVASSSMTHVHYDTLLFLEDLFGGSLESLELQSGIVPLLEVETGAVEGHVDCSEPSRGRAFTKEEMDWAELCLPCITKFVTKERDSCDPMGKEWSKTYSVNARAESTYSQASTVSIFVQYGRGRRRCVESRGKVAVVLERLTV